MWTTLSGQYLDLDTAYIDLNTSGVGGMNGCSCSEHFSVVIHNLREK